MRQASVEPNPNQLNECFADHDHRPHAKESSPNSEGYYDRYSISETESAENSQLHRIARIMQPHHKHINPRSSPPSNRSSDALYFQPNASHSEEQALCYRLNNIPSIDVRSISDSKDSLDADFRPSRSRYGGDAEPPRKSPPVELIKLCDLHERFNQQVSSEEDISANRSIFTE